MKKTALLTLGLGAVLALTGCGRKVEYSEYKEAAKKADEAAEKVDIKKAVLTSKGKMTYSVLGVETSVDFDGKVVMEEDENGNLKLNEEKSTLQKKEAAYTIVASLAFVTASMIPEDSDATYYVGNLGVSYKDEDGNTAKYEFNKYGMVTSYNSKSDKGNMKFSISYTYEKK